MYYSGKRIQIPSAEDFLTLFGFVLFGQTNPNSPGREFLDTIRVCIIRTAALFGGGGYTKWSSASEEKQAALGNATLSSMEPQAGPLVARRLKMGWGRVGE